MSHPTPDREGYYWAKLKLADNPDDNSVGWEVVQVFDNYLRPFTKAQIATGEAMLASLPGLEKSQPIDAFVWGPRIEDFKP